MTTPAEFGESQTSSFNSALSGTPPNAVPSSRMKATFACVNGVQGDAKIDRSAVILDKPIKTLGEHQVPLKLHRDVAAHVNVIVTQDR